jgi:xylulokinase
VLLGIDLGTSGLKAGLYDLGGRLLGQGWAANEYLAGPPGWAEQDPRGWWAGCGAAVRAVLAASGCSPAQVRGVGVCGFHHCPVFLGADGEPARPTIVTHDSRLGASLESLRASGVLKQVVSLSGSRAMAGHLPAIYHHVLCHDRPALDRTRWLLLAKDYIRFKLTGTIGTEVCDATGTHLVAMPEQDWSAELGRLLQVPLDRLPPIGLPTQVCGEVTAEAARATGLRPGTPVVYGGGDSHCALLGLGVAGSGQGGLLLGTNSTLRVSFAGPVRALDYSVWTQQHVVPGHYTVSASSMAGSSVLSWLRERCLGEPNGGDPAAGYRELEALAAAVPPGCDGLLFQPYLFGERSPFYSPQARGAFLGLAHWHGKGHLVRSVMEGVAAAIANCLDSLQAVAFARGERIETLRTAESGGARLPIWRQIIADSLGIPLDVLPVGEPGCLGAALLAGAGVGDYADLSAAIGQAVPVGNPIWPDAARAVLYRERRELSNHTYRLLEPILYH